MISIVNKPIIEGIGIGGIKIGERLEASNEMFQHLQAIYSKNDTTSLVYTYQHVIKIYAKKDTNVIYKISAGEGYPGKFRDQVAVGDTMYDLGSLHTPLLYDDFDGIFYLKHYEGICFETASFHTHNDDLRSIKIDFITVYDTALNTEGFIDELVVL